MKTNIVFFLFTGIVFFSCSYDKGSLPVPITNKTNSCDTIVTVSFSKNVQPVFNAHCIDAGCHSGVNAAANLDLESSTAYTQLMKKGSGYIDTVNPNYSLLYAQMQSVSQPMPPTGKLDTCTLNLVLKWIKQKAKNN